MPVTLWFNMAYSENWFMDDLDKIDKYEWYGLGGGYWYAGEKIDPDDDPNDYVTIVFPYLNRYEKGKFDA